jgi:hypothetical protein
MSVGAVTLSQRLAIEKQKYLEQQGEAGGTASGYRNWIYEKKDQFVDFMSEALGVAATKKWQEPSRSGPDLFSIAGIPIASYLTRPSASFFTGEDIDDEDERFEKVDQRFATVNDLREDALIKQRNVTRSAHAAEMKMRAVDEALRRAKGDLRKSLHEVIDPPSGEKSPFKSKGRRI